MAIKTKKSFNDLLESLVEEILDEEELDEITATGDVAGYNTPNAFSSGGQKDKKKKKKNATNSTGYKIVNETLEDGDLKQIRSLVRDVVANILRDIWIKRTSWK